MKLTKNFWRVITLALALVMLFSVVACGNTEEPAATTEAGADSTAAPTTQAPTTEKPTTAATTEKPTTAPTTEPTTEGSTAGTDDPVTPPADDLSQPDVWDGSVDKTWFDINNIQTEYTFTTAEQFAGFIKLRQENYGNKLYFEGVTIKLARDIILNEGTAEQVKELGALGQAKQLEALHSSKALFKGTFDGQGHTISGAFIDCTNSGYKSLFGGIGDNAVIKNLKVTNSYFNATDSADKYAGAIVVARALGTNMLLSNITVEGALLVESTSQFTAVGILVANLDDASSLTIENCKTAGTINFPTMGTNGQGFGGIIGRVDSGKAEVVDEATGAVTTPLTYTNLVIKNCSSSATIIGTDYCGGLVGTVGDLANVKIDSKSKFTGTITCEGEIIDGETTRPAMKGEFVGSDPDFQPEQPTVVEDFTADDFSAIKYPEFDTATIVIEGAGCEAGSTVVEKSATTYHLYNISGNSGAAANGVIKLAQNDIFHYYIDVNNVNKTIASNEGEDKKIASVDDCYIRWTFTVTEAGTYTVGSYMRLKNNADRKCQVQFDDQTPMIMHYTLESDVSSIQDSTQGSYLMWDGVEVVLEAGEHTLTYTIPAGYDASVGSWHWRTIYLMKKAA